MGKMIASEMLTLDGYFSGPNGETDWFMWDKDTDRETFGMLTHTDCLLLGHETYKVLSGYWPTATEEDPEYINRINSLKKVVVSKNSPSLGWNADILQAPNDKELVSGVCNLKRENNLLIFGSGYACIHTLRTRLDRRIPAFCESVDPRFRKTAIC